MGTTPSVPEAKPHREKSAGYSVIIPEEVIFGDITYAVTAISDGAFHDKVNMTAVEIPASVTAIGAVAFSGCRSLSTITNHAYTPQTITSTVFANVNRTATLVVPASVANAYRNADVWKEFVIEGYADFVLGDANSDGEVTVADLSMTASYILGTESDGMVLEAADVNGDGTITVADLASMASYILNGSWPASAQGKAYMP